MAVTSGCLDERSINLQPGDSVKVSVAPLETKDSTSTRAWLRHAHGQLADLLPPSSASPLLTEDVTGDDGRPIDVAAHFGNDPARLQNILVNHRGIILSARAASREYHIDRPAPPWQGFEDLWIPIDEDFALSGRLGYARDAQGRIIDSDCIVVLPGLFGDNGVKRSADISIALRESGFHVLSLELRGYGQTEARYPGYPSTFGGLETDDLMIVSDWLEALPHVQRTGLIGYCWTANNALLAAWYDGCSIDAPGITPAIRPYTRHHDPARRRYSAGIIAFSPVVRWEVLMDELERPRSRWGSPIYAAIQETVRDRMKRKNYPEISGNLRKLVEHEFEASGIDLPGGIDEGLQFLRLVSYQDHDAGDKLESARMPVLIVHGADDPLVPAQGPVDLVATVENPQVAALVLPSGGHVGFAEYARRYYLSLVTNFFDPARGPARSAPSETLAEQPGPRRPLP